MRSCEKKSAFGCAVPCFMVKVAGVALAVVGLFLALIFIPMRMWLALLGVALLVVGILVFRMA